MASSLALPVTVASWMSEKSPAHEVFDVDASGVSSESAESSEPWVLLLSIGIFVTGEIVHPSSFGILE